MITNAIISLIEAVLDLLPNFNVEVFSFDGSALSLFLVAGYFLPIKTISTLFSLSLAITGLRLVLAIILRVKSFIPGWGN